MSNHKYFSFLIVNHDGVTDIYHNGIPLGVIKDGEFFVHQIKDTKGNLIDFDITSVPNTPFKNLEELRVEITYFLATLIPKDTSYA
jgi:hypothetical protein